jgi:caffeoyl-CoA O-methyltransferase
MIVHPDIERYMYGLLPERDGVLREMEAEAERRNIPIVGPAVGHLLAVLVKATGARRIFELGSAIGYSTVWLARAAGAGAEVHYTDASAANAEEAARYFERAGISDKISIHVGDALESLRQTAGEFDVIFNDVDKQGYPEVFREVGAHLRPGGLFLTDNTLYHERVLAPRDAAARGVVEFNRLLFESPKFFSAMVPLRDGVALAVRIS